MPLVKVENMDKILTMEYYMGYIKPYSEVERLRDMAAQRKNEAGHFQCTASIFLPYSFTIRYSGYEEPYLFIVLETEQNTDELIKGLKEKITNEFAPEEQPKEIFVIGKKPISHFKTDRKSLAKQRGSVEIGIVSAQFII